MGDWAHRFGASPLMRMTASWSWSAWTDRIQVRGAMLRARGRAPLRSLWLTPPGAPCRGPQTEPDGDNKSEEKCLTEKAPYKFADQVQVRPTRLKRLSQSWLSRSRLSDRCAIPLLRPSRAPTAPQPRALRRSRPEPGKSHPWPSRPRRCGPSCWPRPPAPASAACKPACGRSMSRPERHGGPPSAGRHSRR
jgi:hypothetical protein